MPLKPTQKELSADTLYEIALRGSDSFSQLKPNISVQGGSIDIYGINRENIPTALSEMELSTTDTGVQGVREVEIAPTYIAIKNNVGTPTVVLTGFNVKDLGAIS